MDTCQNKNKLKCISSDIDQNKSCAKWLKNSFQIGNEQSEKQERSKQESKCNAVERNKETEQSESIDFLTCSPLDKDVLSELPVNSCLTEGSEMKINVPVSCLGDGSEAEQLCLHNLAETVDICQNIEVSCCRPSLNVIKFCSRAESDGKLVSEDVNNEVINLMETCDNHVRVANALSDSKILIAYERRKRIKTYSSRRKKVVDSSAASSRSIQKGTDSLCNYLDQSVKALASGGSKLENEKEADEVVDNQSQFAMDGTLPDLCVSIDLLSQERSLTQSSRKKLLVLDVNGLLADIVFDAPDNYTPDAIISRKAVFKRPFCDDFLQFCFTRFDVGVWSSRMKRNMELILDFLLGNTKHKLLFCWDQSQCTQTGYNTIENRHKPLLLKKLKKLWEKYEPDLPWERGEYNESNTLLLDDSPHKALCNPPNTAIFPQSYQYTDEKDNLLGPGGDLRVYLEGLAMADNVQKYVQENPFGQQPITDKNTCWHYYCKVIAAGLASPRHTPNRDSAFPELQINIDK